MFWGGHDVNKLKTCFSPELKCGTFYLVTKEKPTINSQRIPWRKKKKEKKGKKRSLKALAFLKNVLLLTSIIYTYQWLNSITQIKPKGNVAVNKLLSQSPLKHQHWAVQRPGMPRQMQKDLQIWKSYRSWGTAASADPKAHLGSTYYSLSFSPSLMLIQSMKH